MKSCGKPNKHESEFAVLFVEGKTEYEFFQRAKHQLPFRKIRVINKRGRNTLLKEAQKDFQRVRSVYRDVAVIWVLDTEGEEVERLQEYFPECSCCVVGYATPQFAAWLLADFQAVQQAAKSRRSKIPVSIARKSPEELPSPEHDLIRLLGNSDKVTTALRVARYFCCDRARKRSKSLKKFCEELEKVFSGKK